MKVVVLLTGSTGYIGQHLLRYWSKQGAREVIRVDRAAGLDLSASGWTSLLPDRKVEVVIHLAQSQRYREFPAGAQDMFRVNVKSTVELLEWARSHGVRRFLLASSGSVYAPRPGKLTETADCAPTSMYAATKLSAEYLTQPYSAFFEIVIVRLFTVYGMGQRQMLIADMIERVEKGKEIRLAGGAGIYLTPVFVEDCVKALSVLAAAPLEESLNILNVAGDEVLSLGEIVAMLAAKLEKDPVIIKTDDQPGYLCGDNTRLKVYYDNFMPFADGLELTLRNQRRSLLR
jgi:UDP-glucose 4-epimerase